jgi:hypothetical protein
MPAISAQQQRTAFKPVLPPSVSQAGILTLGTAVASTPDAALQTAGSLALQQCLTESNVQLGIAIRKGVGGTCPYRYAKVKVSLCLSGRWQQGMLLCMNT